MRSVAFIHSPLMDKVRKSKKRDRRASSALMSVTDWLATLLGRAGLSSLLPPATDSLDQWTALTEGQLTPRNQVISLPHVFTVFFSKGFR